MEGGPGLVATIAALVFAACSEGPPPKGPGTYAIDCVGVLGFLGTMPPTQRIPLSSIPSSGAPRDKRYDELSDAELGKVCDFGECLGKNGYGRACYVSAPNRYGASGAFKAETVPLVADGMESCFPSKSTETTSSFRSREECIELLRNFFGDCRVGPGDDCLRESASGAFPPGAGPGCSQNCGPGRIGP